MTYEDIVSLGWKDIHQKQDRTNHATFVYEAAGFDYHIMSAAFNVQEDDGVFTTVMINCVPENQHSNIWENSETHFYGDLKTKQELYLVMQFLGIVKYVGLTPPKEGGKP